MSFQIQIEDSVVLPKRETNFGPRESKYPFAQMHEGQGFVLPVEGSDAEKREASARQKQSSFSSIGKRMGIKINTRYVAEKPADGADPYLVAKWAQVGGPFLVVKHAGARAATPETTSTATEATEAAATDASDDLLDDA